MEYSWTEPLNIGCVLFSTFIFLALLINDCFISVNELTLKDPYVLNLGSNIVASAEICVF